MAPVNRLAKRQQQLQEQLFPQPPDCPHEKVAAEVIEILDEMNNNNVIGCHENRMRIWDRVFRRLLRMDGKRAMLHKDKLRFDVKAKAHETLSSAQHAYAHESANEIMDFMEDVEVHGDYNEKHFGQQ